MKFGLYKESIDESLTNAVVLEDKKTISTIVNKIKSNKKLSESFKFYQNIANCKLTNENSIKQYIELNSEVLKGLKDSDVKSFTPSENYDNPLYEIVDNYLNSSDLMDKIFYLDELTNNILTTIKDEQNYEELITQFNETYKDNSSEFKTLINGLIKGDREKTFNSIKESIIKKLDEKFETSEDVIQKNKLVNVKNKLVNTIYCEAKFLEECSKLIKLNSNL